MPDADLNRRLEELVRRIEAIETHLDLPVRDATPAPDQPITSLTTEPTSPVDVGDLPETPTGTPASATPPERTVPAPVNVIPPKRRKLPAWTPSTADEVTAETTPPSSAPPLSPPGTPPPAAPAPQPGRAPRPPRDISVENFIGGRIAPIAGALILIIGAALGLKLAWDAQVFDLLPDQLKCVLAALFGGALLAGGEFARRKISAWASIGLTTAGLGVLYATSYAAYGFFEVVPASIGFTFLVTTTALGIAIGARAGMVSIAALSLIGGYLSPLIFIAVDSSPYILPLYLMALLCVGLVLCARFGGRYAVLRSISWWGTILFGTGWIFGSTTVGALAHLVFIVCVWSAVYIELVYSAARRQLTDVEKTTGEQFVDSWFTVRPLASAFTTTAWAIAMAIWAFRADGYAEGLWQIPAYFAAALTAVTSPIAGLRFVLREFPKTDIQRLGSVFAVQIGALVITAVAMGFDGWTAVMAWTVLGLGAVIAGESMRSRALVVYGMIVQAIGGMNVLTLGWWNVPAAGSNVIAGFSITRGTVLLAVSALAWIVTGVLLRRSSTPATVWRSIAHGVIGLGITMSFASLLTEDTTMLQSAWVIIALSATVMLIGTYLRSAGLQIYSLSVQCLSISFMFLQMWWTETPVQMMAGLALTQWTPPMLAITTVGLASAWIVSAIKQEQWRPVAVVIAAVAIDVLFASVLHMRSHAESVMLFWLMLSVALFATHAIRPQLEFARIALFGSIAAIVPWIVAHPPGSWDAQTLMLALTPGLWYALLVTATQYGLAFAERRRLPGNEISKIIATVVVSFATILLFGSTSLEAARIAEDVFSAQSGQRAAVSIWWGIFALAMLVIGFARHIAVLRHLGLGLLAFATIKAVVFDLADVAAGWRVASFLILGLFILGVGVAYARVMAIRNASDLRSNAEPAHPAVESHDS
ncbi:MAG: DUF2339 domain-containing protein [Planctomycetota bacterium]